MTQNIETAARSLGGRNCLRPGFAFGHVKVQNPAFQQARREFPYSGPVTVSVPGCAPFQMMYDNDDIVAGVCFYFGEGSYETLSTTIFGVFSQRSNHVIDLGGHTGIFSCIAASASRSVTVHYFEILPHIAERAHLNFLASGLEGQMRLNAVGVSRAPGRMIVNYNANVKFATGSSIETFADRAKAKGAAQLEVTVTTLDDYWRDAGRPRFDLMKIDVERHELAVFAGGQGMLSTCRPVILSEVLSRAEFQSYFDALAPLGYTHAYKIDDDALKLLEVDRALKFADGSDYVYRGYHNVIFSAGALDRQIMAETSAALARSRVGASRLAV
ncbi:MAG: FkbM family methyltransferase [Pikeienuella sp.]|uniref:FkbM family methyltransferase n=1 Tax=Pikeienuella sp. TaxID=2831957 RepID=UPI00391D8D32